MKFRTSFQLSREPREDGSSPSMPFNMSSLRHKKSKPVFEDESEEQPNAATKAEMEDAKLPKRRFTFGQLQKEQVNATAPRTSSGRKQAVQEFFRNTSANLKATGANIRASSTKIQHRIPVRSGHHKTRVAKAQPTSKRNSRQMRSFDISDEVLDKLMGPRTNQFSGKIQSDRFFVNQRVRAASHEAPSLYVNPLSGRSQAEMDKKPLSQQEVEEMFVGAPYFNVEKLQDGRYRPQIIFRGGDVEESKKYGRDYVDLGHSSFGACTLGLHRTKETADRTPWRGDGTRTEDAAMLEVPSMLSANGLDPGTIGFEHFLQLPIADSMILTDEPVFFEKRKLLYSEPERLGLRELRLEIIIERLTVIADLVGSRKSDEPQAQSPWSEEKIAEMGEDLFANVLDSELGTTGAGTGSVTLRTQIAALQKVLNVTELWHDFSQVEWRIRVGQLLWATQEDEVPQLDENRQPSERDVLLAQIMLAGELMVRLDAFKNLATIVSFPPLVSPADKEAVRAAQTSKVQWDVLLARTFLENMIISANVKNAEGKTGTGNRSSLFSAISFLTAKEMSEDAAESSIQPFIFAKDEEQQFAGLLYFAEALRWPHADGVRSELEAKLARSSKSAKGTGTEGRQRMSGVSRPVSGSSLYATPLSSPRLPGYTPGINRNSYFGGWLNSQHAQQRPGFGRSTTANSVQLLAASSPAISDHPGSANGHDRGVAGFEVGGWLSRSWLTGLVLPGEPASHFLISTLLENSPQAIEVLGDSANLYGGFVYQNQIFSSKSSILAQVLGASRAARDCMGWMSIPNMLGAQAEEGWVDLNVKDAPSAKSARVKEVEIVAKASDPLHGSSITSLQAGDFVTAIDGPPILGNEVKCHGLSFTPSPFPDELAKAADGTSIQATSTSIAHLSFSLPSNLKLARLEVPLAYDVHFVASYPCHPQPLLQARRSSSKGLSASSSKAVSPIEGEPRSKLPPTVEPPFHPDMVDTFLDAKETNNLADSARASGITVSIADIEKELPPPPAHSLHVEYHYSVIPVATLLSAPAKTRPRALSSPEDRVQQAIDSSSDPEEVIVLDCRGTDDLELLARAWCAKVGENALIGKAVRTCLACCVREARALGIEVVIRI